MGENIDFGPNDAMGVIISLTLDDGEEENVNKSTRYPRPRMKFSYDSKEGRPRGMALFCLVYPSDFLTKAYNPVTCLNDNMSFTVIRAQLKAKIKGALDKYPESTHDGSDGKRWYYLAPLLLDEAKYVEEWFCNEEETAEVDRNNRYKDHLTELQNIYKRVINEGTTVLGKRPEDLLDVLTDMALASPAITVNRTYRIYENGFKNNLPSRIAKEFINRMNTTEATAVVEVVIGKKSDDAHWQNLLTYGVNGNLQAVWDEYAHMITSGMDKSTDIVQKLHNEILNGMKIRVTRYAVDTLSTFKKRIKNNKKGKKPRMMFMRTHFAVSFTRGVSKEKDTDRKKTVRNAFNSPFRPFVLASTSVGQEGLDFHNYCRRIVHWNLPGNPIDLEQREGRINRFECLAIRQNVVKRYGNIRYEKDVWNEMFEEAYRKENGGKQGCSDLIPYWGLSKAEDMVKIERIVPMYPFSKDGLNYERLIKILSLYRLTLGQARQEELLDYIFKNYDEKQQERLRKLFINLSPFYKE